MPGCTVLRSRETSEESWYLPPDSLCHGEVCFARLWSYAAPLTRGPHQGKDATGAGLASDVVDEHLAILRER